MTIHLSDKKCVACEGGVLSLEGERLTAYSQQLPEWKVAADAKSISREFVFKNFKHALAFVNKVGAIAESEGHHPDINLHGYKNVLIRLSTHAIGGLSENDFIVAAKINLI